MGSEHPKSLPGGVGGQLGVSKASHGQNDAAQGPEMQHGGPRNPNRDLTPKPDTKGPKMPLNPKGPKTQTQRDSKPNPKGPKTHPKGPKNQTQSDSKPNP